MQMKKMAAIFLALVMILSVASMSVLADITPSITVIGNEAAPGADTTFQVKLADFSDVKGMDITITATDGVVFKDITSEDVTLTKDSNYTLSANKIQIVELNAKSDLTLTVTATVNADADISVTAKLAASATELVKNVSIVNGKLTTAPLTQALGAQVRAGGAPYGLRFILEAQCSGAALDSETFAVDYANAKVTINGTARTIARIGALVARADKADASDLVADSSNTLVQNVEAKKAYEVAADSVRYAVTITGIPSAAADKVMHVRPYIAYYDDNNAINYVYGNVLSRCVNDVSVAE